MIRCEECLRANPPTRFACLYCNVPLPVNDSTAHLRKPILRKPDKHELGFNCVLLVTDSLPSDEDSLTKAAGLLKLDPEIFATILSINAPMPLARTANHQEAQLVKDSVLELGFPTVVLSDEDLGRDDTVIRV